VLPDPVYRFKHVLTQEVAYDSLLLHQRKSLHRAVGEAIESLFADRIEERLELLAHHYSHAEDWSSAAKFGLESAEKASGLSRFSEALTMLEQTEGWLFKLDESDDRQQKLGLVLLKQERLCETLGFRDRQQALIDRLVSFLDPERDPAFAAKVYVRQGELHTLLGRYEEAERILKESLAISRALSDWTAERMALRTMGFMYWRWGRHDEAVESNKTAVAIDLAQGDMAGYAQDLTNLGSVLRSQGRLREALEHLEEALKIQETFPQPFNGVYTLDVTANVYRDLGDNDKAMEYYRRTDNQAVQHRLPLHRMIPLSSLASVLWEQGRFEESLDHVGEVIALGRSLNMVRQVAESLTTLSQRLLALDRPGEALSHLSEATEIYARLGDRDDEARALTSLAYVREQCSAEPAEILATWERLRSLRCDRFDQRGQLEALEGLARTARHSVQDPSLALEYLWQALQIAEQLDDGAKQGDLLNTMGILEWGRGNYAASLEHYQQALRLFQQAGDRVHSGLMLNSIGVTMARLGRKAEAIGRFNEALLLHRETHQRLLEGHALAARGDVLVDLGSIDEALESYHESLAIRREIEDRKGEGWMLSSLARVYFLREEAERARALLDEAKEIARETSDQRLMEECERLARQ
jgi:tetratricopeptide (TPR) repeat protein